MVVCKGMRQAIHGKITGKPTLLQTRYCHSPDTRMHGVSVSPENRIYKSSVYI